MTHWLLRQLGLFGLRNLTYERFLVDFEEFPERLVLLLDACARYLASLVASHLLDDLGLHPPPLPLQPPLLRLEPGVLPLLPLEGVVDPLGLPREDVDLPREGADGVVVHLPVHRLLHPMLQVGQLPMHFVHIGGVGTQEVRLILR